MIRQIFFTLFTSIGVFAANAQSLSPSEFNSNISGDKKAVVIDVRTPNEFGQGHIKNAVNINWMDSTFLKKASTVDKAAPVYVYCLSGGRSAKAATKLRAEGYKVYELDGGLLKWRAARMPEEKGRPVSNTGLTVEDFHHLINSNKKVLVDFYAEWCGPCKLMEGYMKDIDKNMKNVVKVVRIDVDKNEELARALEIDALPLVMVYENNRLKWQKTGYASKKEVLKQIK